MDNPAGQYESDEILRLSSPRRRESILIPPFGDGIRASTGEAVDDDLAYTSVLSALQTLEEKGHVRHEQEGRAYRYFPTVAQAAAGRSALERIRDSVYHGSAEMLFAQLVSDRRLKPTLSRRWTSCSKRSSRGPRRSG